MQYTIEELTALFNKAAQAARDSLTGNDGGSCNLDNCYVEIVPGLRQALEKSRLSGFESDGIYMNITPQYGRQGFERTSQCEAIAKVFKEAGIKSYVDYVMD